MTVVGYVSGIYQIRQLSTGKCYVGSSVNIYLRFKDHRKLLKRGIHHSIHLQRAWNRRGLEDFVFEVLELVALTEKLVEREQAWMDFKSSHACGFNIAPQAGNTLGVKHTAESRAKIKAARARQVITPEHRAAIAKGSTGRKQTPESIAKTAAANRGKVVSQETRAKLSAINTGKTLTEDQIRRLKSALAREDVKAKMSRLGWRHSEESRAKISNSLTGGRRSPEASAKAANSNRGKKRSEETRAKLVAAWERRRARLHPGPSDQRSA